MPDVSSLTHMRTRVLASLAETHLEGEVCRQPQRTYTPVHPTLKGSPSRPQQSPVGSEGGHFISLCAHVSVSRAGGGEGEGVRAGVGRGRMCICDCQDLRVHTCS